MTFRVRVTQSMIYDGVMLSIGRPAGDRVQMVKELGPHGPVYEMVEPFCDSPHTLSMSDDLAMPLLDALAMHYSGTSDMRTLRADYVAERARVDKFIDAAIRTLTTR